MNLNEHVQIKLVGSYQKEIQSVKIMVGKITKSGETLFLCFAIDFARCVSYLNCKLNFSICMDQLIKCWEAHLPHQIDHRNIVRLMNLPRLPMPGLTKTIANQPKGFGSLKLTSQYVLVRLKISDTRLSSIRLLVNVGILFLWEKNISFLLIGCHR